MFDADGKVRKTTAGTRWTVGKSGFPMWTGKWELFDLPAGEYTVEMTALDRDGKVLARRTERIVHGGPMPAR